MYKSPPFDLVTAPAHFIRPQRACGENMRTPVYLRDMVTVIGQPAREPGLTDCVADAHD
jgi:hypothetical protein